MGAHLSQSLRLGLLEYDLESPMSDEQDSSESPQQQLFQSPTPPNPQEALLHARARLLGKAAHEIYNATTPLVANLTTLRGDLLAGELDPELAVEMLDECLEGIGRTTDVLRRLRELSRIKGALRLERLDLSAAVSQVCTALQERRGLALDADLESVWVRASPDVLALVLGHLIDAWLGRLPALEASVGLGLQLRVRAVSRGGELELRDLRPVAEDDGLEGVFSAFRQGDGHEQGTWLFVSRTLIQDMGGTLEAQVDGGQATLRLLLPRS